MKRRPIELRQLVPLGGEADSPVESGLLECPASVESQNIPYNPKCAVQPFALEGSDVHTAGSASDLLDTPLFDDDEVDQVAQALVREYLNKKKMNSVLKLFDELSPRQPSSISSRAKLRKMLGLGEPHKSFGVMEQVIAQRLVDTRRGHHITLGDAPQNTLYGPGYGDVKWDMCFNGSTVSVGEFVIDDSGTKRGDRIAPQKTFCDLVSNQIIDHFSDLDMANKVPLGKGASGEVFGVMHKPTGKEVAVKMIKAMEKRQMEEISKELRTLFDIKHPNILNYHGSFYDNGCIIIALEKMSESLNSLVKRCAATELAAKACIFQVLNALNHLHVKRKVIHRDIKPANILYNMKGEVKVGDFGVSSGPVASLYGNVANTFVGTLAFMSPERCRGGDYSFHSDIWSLGLVLYYLVAAKLPYNTPNPLFSIIEGDPPRLSEDCPDMSREALDFYNRCVAKDPADRSTCKDLLMHPWFRTLADNGAREAVCTWLADADAAEQEKDTSPEDGEPKLQAQYDALDAALGDL
eukprot:TRINITY_DN34392_c0_g1_i2.p1 TRINITY_DN34392_c0_g1~~TRINITY_DN34392_c0_g1_i2.p1  ORF type:complete len:523 (+),score=145.20 TRINITY_DN34392_c0_g1_i2:20-1588(+)